MDCQHTFTLFAWNLPSFNIDNSDNEIVKDFAFLGSVINSNGNYSQEIKADTQKDDNGRIRKGHQEQRSVIRDQS